MQSYRRLQDGDAFLEGPRWAWLDGQLALNRLFRLRLRLGRGNCSHRVNVIVGLLTARVSDVERG